MDCCCCLIKSYSMFEKAKSHYKKYLVLLVLHLIVITVDSAVEFSEEDNFIRTILLAFGSIPISVITIVLSVYFSREVYLVGFGVNFVLSIITFLVVPSCRGDATWDDWKVDGSLRGTILYLVAFAACNICQLLLFLNMLLLVTFHTLSYCTCEDVYEERKDRVDETGWLTELERTTARANGLQTLSILKEIYDDINAESETARQQTQTQPTSNFTTNPNPSQAYGVGQPNFTPGMKSQPTSTLTVIKTGLKEIYDEIKAESATTSQQSQTPGIMSQPTSNYTTNPNSTQSYGVGQPNFTTNPYATQAHSTGQSYSTTNPDPAQAYGVNQPNIMTNPETSQAYGSGQPNTGVWQVPSDPHRQYPSGAGHSSTWHAHENPMFIHDPSSTTSSNPNAPYHGNTQQQLDYEKAINSTIDLVKKIKKIVK